MVHSRKPKSNSILSETRRVLHAYTQPGDHLTVALSGGVDSVVLLRVLAELADEIPLTLSAVHVHHGISGNSTLWSQFCCELCHGYGIAIHVAYLRLNRSKNDSLEAIARTARYRVFGSLQSDYVVLAQHADDQVETLMLQLLRGAGVKGLSSMPPVRNQNGDTPRILRPFLKVSRKQIEAYARQHRLNWINDESNDSTAFSRNFLRHEILPLLKQRYPGYAKAMLRTTRHVAEASSLLDELAQSDYQSCTAAGMLRIDRLRTLSIPRTKNLLRYLLFQQGITPPNTAKLEEMVRQITLSRHDRQVSLPFGATEIRCFHGAVHILPRVSPMPSTRHYPWHGEEFLVLNEWNGVLRFDPAENHGIDARKMHAAQVTVRLRQGGEHFKPHCNRPTRSLKNLLQEAAIAPWQRNTLPLLFCDERLVWVPGIGIDCEFQVKSGELGILPIWHTQP